MNIKTFAAVSLIAAATALSGCASMVHGTSQYLNVKSQTPDATIYLNGEPKGIGEINFEASKRKSYTVKVAAPGCTDTTRVLDRHFDPAFLLNVPMIIGVVGIVGVVVDIADGAVVHRPQTNYIVNPVCSKPAIATHTDN